jgi:hypothetical protein
MNDLLFWSILEADSVIRKAQASARLATQEHTMQQPDMHFRNSSSFPPSGPAYDRAESWETTPQGWRSRHIHRQHYDPRPSVDWSGVLIVLGLLTVVAAVILAHTFDFRGM